MKDFIAGRIHVPPVELWPGTERPGEKTGTANGRAAAGDQQCRSRKVAKDKSKAVKRLFIFYDDREVYVLKIRASDVLFVQ